MNQIRKDILIVWVDVPWFICIWRIRDIHWNIKSLISNFYNTSNNTATNAHSGCSYLLVEGE